MSKVNFLLIFLLFATLVKSQCEFDLYTDLTIDSCHANEMTYEEVNCIPSCTDEQRDKEPSSCEYWWDLVISSAMYNVILNFKATCLRSGKYGPKQCKGQPTTGRCFCSDEDGNRLDGQQWWDKAENMTCACSRRKHDLQNAEGMPYYISLHCDHEGNYEALQCDTVSEQCWCAEPKTGDLISKIVPMPFMKQLPCFDITQNGNNYLRQCESEQFAQKRILYEHAIHGTSAISFTALNCDYDGSYGAYRKEKSIALCTWKDNVALDWQSEINDLTILTCNCARDSKIFEASGRIQTQTCEGNGNYKKLQTENGEMYCVDSDGYNIGYGENGIKNEQDCDALIPND